MGSFQVDRRTVLGGAAAAAAASLAGGTRAFAADQKFVPYSNKSLDYYFFVAQEEAVKRAVEGKGWRFQAVNASFDNTTQLQQWDSAAQRPFGHHQRSDRQPGHRQRHQEV